jgi:hypothetical protein
MSFDLTALDTMVGFDGYEYAARNATNGVYDDRTVFACIIMTSVWVSHMRNEPITKKELFEMLGVKGWEGIDDSIYQFNEDYESFEHEELLVMVASSF